jgi:hypothetical protein
MRAIVFQLALTLLVLGRLADDAQTAMSLDDPAVPANGSD